MMLLGSLMGLQIYGRALFIRKKRQGVGPGGTFQEKQVVERFDAEFFWGDVNLLIFWRRWRFGSWSSWCGPFCSN